MSRKMRYSTLLERTADAIEAQPELWCQGVMAARGSDGKHQNCAWGQARVQLGVSWEHQYNHADVLAVEHVIEELDELVVAATEDDIIEINDAVDRTPLEVANQLRAALPHIRKRERQGGKRYLAAFVVPQVPA
jgi:hypothetical protein